MIPDQIRATYPDLTAVIESLLSSELREVASDVKQQGASELSSLVNSADLEVLAKAVFIQGAEPAAVFKFGIAAYRTLRGTEDVPRFVGRTWSYAMSSWGTEQRKQFLELTVADSHQVFFALDLTAEMLQYMDLSAAEALPWIEKAYRAVSRDLMQRGLWLSLQAFCGRSPNESLSVIEMWLALSPDDSAQNAIAKMLGYTRKTIAGEGTVAQRLERLEERLRLGHPSWRAMWMRSWAESSASLDERNVLAIRPSDFRDRDQELSSWIFLLSVIALERSDTWVWTVREICVVASPSLSPEAKYWICMAAARAIEAGGSLAPDWQRLLVAIMPISAEHDGIWNVIEHHLVDLAEKSPDTLRSVMRDLARYSGKAFTRRVKARKFSYLTSVLTRKGLHRQVSSDLCFGSNVPARQLGLLLFSECGVDQLDTATIQAAPEQQLELLLLEAQRTNIDYEALGRLHACLAPRVDQFTGELLFLFYDEVALQGLNTHGYREALKRHASTHEYIKAILEDVDRRLAETAEAAKSPALQMNVPYRDGAEIVSAQKMVRDVAKGVREHSIFLNLVHRVTLLYGGQTWRMFMPDGTLSEPSQMHKSSAAVEVPRMEITDLEGMHVRRLNASMRIAKIEAGSHPEDEQ